MKQKMKRSFHLLFIEQKLQYDIIHTINRESHALLPIHYTPNGLKLHLLRSCNYFHPLLMQVSPNYTRSMRLPNLFIYFTDLPTYVLLPLLTYFLIRTLYIYYM